MKNVYNKRLSKDYFFSVIILAGVHPGENWDHSQKSATLKRTLHKNRRP